MAVRGIELRALVLVLVIMAPITLCGVYSLRPRNGEDNGRISALCGASQSAVVNSTSTLIAVLGNSSVLFICIGQVCLLLCFAKATQFARLGYLC